MSARDKLLTRPMAIAKVRAAQQQGERVVFTNGCFDWLHVGHVRMLEAARALGDRLVVAVNSDASVRQLKGAGRPLVPLRQRMELIGALGCVDWVILFRDATPRATIRALRPDVLAKGGDWPLDRIVGADDVRGWGGRVVSLPETAGLHTSALIARARDRT